MPLKLLPIKPKRSGLTTNAKALCRWSGMIAETGQIVDVDFRQGNVPPAQGNLAFIKQCQQSLPEGYAVSALRIDAAGYQTKIIE